MACSKSVFSDLPELVYEIIQYFHNDYKTLSSCILVNRLWCRLAIPLLWEDPFSTFTKNCNFIEIYLQYLDDKDKEKLKDYGIKINNSFNLNTLLFNYPNFIKNLNTCKIVYSIEKWILAFKRNQNKNLLPPIFTTTLYYKPFLNDIDYTIPEFDVNLNFIRRSDFNLPPITNLINSTGSTQSFQSNQSNQSDQSDQAIQRSLQSFHDDVQSLRLFKDDVQSTSSLRSFQDDVQSTRSLQDQSLRSFQDIKSTRSLQDQSLRSFQDVQSTQSLQDVQSTQSLRSQSAQSLRSFQDVQSAQSLRSFQDVRSTQSLRSFQTVQSTQSLRSFQTAQSTQSSQSTQPTQSTQSIQPTQSTQSIQPTQSTQFTQQTQSIQPTQSTHSTHLTQSTHSLQSLQSFSPTQPLPQNITSLFKNGKKGLIYKLLFKLFIKHEAKLHTFEVFLMRIKEYKYFNNIYDLILENPKFIRSIKNLKLAFYNKGTSNLSKIDSFITFLSSNCDSISSLYLQFQFRNNNILIEKFSSRIINSQKNIKRIFFVHNTFSLNTSLLSLKNFYYSNNLKTITFFNVNFKNIIIIKEVFEQLNVLESIHILYCQFINSFIKQIIKMIGPFKLRSLFLDKIIKLNSFNSLLQKSGNYLENFGLGTISKDESKKHLLELIIKYCKNIKFFDLPEFDNQDNIYSALNLIKILDQNLNYLFIEFFDLNLNSNKISSILLKELGQLLPIKLEYLKLSLIININDFKIFLLNSQNTFIKKFLIRNKIKLLGNFDDFLSLIDDYIIKFKKVKYLAFKEDFIEGRDLFLLKDYVKKFELYNIKIQSYDDLDTYNSYKHVKETY
ncbi:hypothetical protein RhiirB3_432957 [Rhizophagus irregularis]|nr:hypothetical protein RhiirB3_432957 [Rhizophagus irregularis]